MRFGSPASHGLFRSQQSGGPAFAGWAFYAERVKRHEPNEAPVIVLTRGTVTREPLWRHVVGDVLRRERLAQQRTLKDVADAARISMPYLSELERGRKEGSSEVLAAAAHALGLGLADLLELTQRELARVAAAGTAERRAGLAPVPVHRSPGGARAATQAPEPADETVALECPAEVDTVELELDGAVVAAATSVLEACLAARDLRWPASRRAELCLAA